MLEKEVQLGESLVRRIGEAVNATDGFELVEALIALGYVISESGNPKNKLLTDSQRFYAAIKYLQSKRTRYNGLDEIVNRIFHAHTVSPRGSGHLSESHSRPSEGQHSTGIPSSRERRIVT